MSSSSTQNQLEMRDYTCPECNIGLRVLSLPSASPPYCPLCNVASYFTSSTPFEVGPNPFEDDEESQFLDPMESLPTIKISSSMLSSASSDDSALPCAISEKISCHNSFPLCRVELPVASSEDDSGLDMWFDALNLEDDLEEEAGVTLDLEQSLRNLHINRVKIVSDNVAAMKAINNPKEWPNIAFSCAKFIAY
ncbi:unnamed protein product [Arabidopsis thaliana]|uniref:(thale cress) hypothetical protein n=1 Tax=Arabidopsis thaliana TaxID=3702 RepID=A0A7G2EGU4_ARATH|nr:unnamed protein product [Arabidopsis thaliana]